MLCPAEAQARLQSLGIERFVHSRLSQLYHALDNQHSRWFDLSEEGKQEIRADVVAILGKIPKLVTIETLAADAANAAITKAKRKARTLDFVFLTFICDGRLRKILVKRFPKRPYCSDNLENEGSYIRRLDIALHKKYVQYNPPGWKSIIVVDVDRAVSDDEWHEASLPPPTWVSINPANDHAHYAWVLEKPVWSGGDNQRPARYFAAVQEAFRLALKGDAGFSHTLTKNPVSHEWMTSSPSGFDTYELAYLAAFVNIKGIKKSRKKASDSAVGRNCGLFDEVRHWAYSAVNGYTSSVTFGMAVQVQLEAANLALSNPMIPREVLHIGRSISRWTWKNRSMFAAMSRSLSERQAERGKASGEARLAKNQDKRSRTILMRADGMSVTAIATEMQVHRDTIYSWLK